jgi:hypothetical protein
MRMWSLCKQTIYKQGIHKATGLLPPTNKICEQSLFSISSNCLCLSLLFYSLWKLAQISDLSYKYATRTTWLPLFDSFLLSELQKRPVLKITGSFVQRHTNRQK